MKKKSLFILLLVFLAIIISLYFDSAIVKGVSFIRNEFLDEFFIGITSIVSGVIIFFILTSLFLWKEHKRRWIIPLWLSLTLSAVVGFLLKILIQRQRPFQLGIVPEIPILQTIGYSTWNFSFPSFQAMLAFCALPILSKEFPRFKYVWIVFAALVAFSRVYFGVHFLSDIIAGGFLGYLIGTLAVKLELDNSFGQKIYKKIFRR